MTGLNHGYPIARGVPTVVTNAGPAINAVCTVGSPADPLVIRKAQWLMIR